MFLLFPYTIDAPIYHRPFGTGGLIVANILIFFLVGEEATWRFTLQYGSLDPVQWITCNFLHGDFGHLFWNMVFLWVFGLVIEGKVGWWRFLVAYLAIGVVGAAVEQLALLSRDEGGSLALFIG